MNFEILVPILLGAFGFAYITGHSKISLPFRVLLGGADAPVDEAGAEVGPPRKPLVPYVGPFLVTLIECCACQGFWVGLMIGAVIGVPPEFLSGVLDAVRSILWLIAFGCIVSGSNFIVGRATGLI